MKKKIILLLLICFAVCAPVNAVYADESSAGNNVPQEEIADDLGQEEGAETPEKSALALWWENSVEPFVWQYATALAGALSGIAVLIGWVRKTLKALKGSKDAYDEDLGKAKASLDAAVKRFEEEKANSFAQIAELREQIRSAFADLAKTVESDLSGIHKDTAKALEMAYIAFTNDKDLVVNGHAKKIAKIARGGDSPDPEGGEHVDES